MLSVLDSIVAFSGSGVAALASVLTPLLGGTSTAAAIVLGTIAVRLLLLPLSLTAIRSANAQRALRPKELRLRSQHAGNPGRLLRELTDLRREHGVSPFASVWPLLAQAPFVAVLYRLFTSPTIGGTANLLLTHTVFGAPLGGRLLTAPMSGLAAPDVLVYLAVFALLGVVAWWSARLARQLMTPAPELPAVIGKVTPLLSYGTLLAAAFVPLAAALYLLTSTAWSTAERWAWAGRSV